MENRRVLLAFISGFIIGVLCALVLLRAAPGASSRAQMFYNVCPRLADGSSWCEERT